MVGFYASNPKLKYGDCLNVLYPASVGNSHKSASNPMDDFVQKEGSPDLPQKPESKTPLDCIYLSIFTTRACIIYGTVP